MPSLSPTCISLVKNFEGYRAAPVRLPDGRWLMGYGHVRSSPPVAPIDEKEADEILKEDLSVVAQSVNTLVLTTLTQCQFDALVSFAFSIGLRAFEDSDVLRFINAGEPIAAACALDAWRQSGAGEPMVLDALVRRRAVEKSLFLYEGIRAPAASALVRPQVDPTAALLAAPVRAMTTDDETARKLRAILVREPQTAVALQPAPEPSVSEEEVSPSPALKDAVKGIKPQQRDLIGYAALGALGLLLMGMGVSGADSDNGVAHIMFTVPGVIATVMSAFYLLKSAATS
jgi:lysozyme